MTQDRDRRSAEPDHRGDPPYAGDPIGYRMWLAMLALCCASMLAHALLYPRLPDLIPTHWGAHGVDSWSPKWIALFFDAIPFLIVVTLWIVPRIDPRGRNFDRFKRVYLAFALLSTLFVTTLTWLVEFTVFALAPQIMETGVTVRITYAVIGIGALGLGNFLPRVRQNYFFGFRTPWALHDERNWFLTHRFAGGATILIGIAYLVASVSSTSVGYLSQGVILTITLAGVRAAVPLYSLAVFRRGNTPLRKRVRRGSAAD